MALVADGDGTIRNDDAHRSRLKALCGAGFGGAYTLFLYVYLYVHYGVYGRPVLLGSPSGSFAPLVADPIFRHPARFAGSPFGRSLRGIWSLSL